MWQSFHQSSAMSALWLLICGALLWSDSHGVTDKGYSVVSPAAGQVGVTDQKILCVGEVRESHSGLPCLLLLPFLLDRIAWKKIYWSRQSFWDELQYTVLYFYFSGHQGFLPFNSIACPDVSALCTPSCGLLWQLHVQTSFCSLWLLLPAGTVW